MNRARRGEVHVPLKLTRRSWGAAHLGEGVDGTKDLRHELRANVSARPCEGDLGPYLGGQVHTETLRDAVTDEVAIDRLASGVHSGRVREALSLAHKSVQIPHQLFKNAHIQVRLGDIHEDVVVECQSLHSDCLRSQGLAIGTTERGIKTCDTALVALPSLVLS